MNALSEISPETARVSADEEKKKWAKLKGLARAPGRVVIILFAYALCTFFLPPPPHSSIFISSLLFPPPFLLGISVILVGLKRRNKILLEIIQKEAPELYQKLKDKGIDD
jgi:hypothetical protein